MKTEHKAWDWNKNESDIWTIPSEDSWHLLHRWKAGGCSTFLDLGCGLGRHSLQFAREGFTVSSFDLSPVAVETVRESAAKEHLSVDAQTGDMTELPYPDASFDCLLAYHVISHTDTAGIRKVIGEIGRVLKPGAEFFLTLCSKNARSYKDAGFPKIDENTVRKIEDGPENGIPHFFADDAAISDLFRELLPVSVKHVQDLVVDSKPYGSWHYFILGKKPDAN
jgi:SAM-dependent methyltransferase